MNGTDFNNQFRSFPFILLLLIIGFVSFNTSFSEDTSFFALTALADEDEEDEDEDEYEDEEEEEEEEEEDDNRKQSTKEETVEVAKEVIEYKPVVQTVTVTDEAYQKDTDGDLLVDAIDPDPLVHQAEYFTDTDLDGVPNAIDQFHDEDDFSYYEFETDDNNNGILDSYES